MTTYTLYAPPGAASGFQAMSGNQYTVISGIVSGVLQRDLPDFIRSGFTTNQGSGGGGVVTQTISGTAGLLSLVSGKTNVILANTASAPVSYTMPAASGSGTVVVIKDSANNAGANNVTGTGSFDNLGSSVLNTNSQSVTFVDNGTSWSLI